MVVTQVLATQEAHASTDLEQGSIVLKIFLSNYATVALIILVAYGKAPSLPPVLRILHIFNGVYGDFNGAWYGQIGFYLASTFLVQSFSPLVFHLVRYYTLQPLLRAWHHKRVAERRSHSIATQRALNLLEVGPVFDSTDHSAQLLTLLFVQMTFGCGIPLLTPLCLVAFVCYFRVDKLLLCR